MKSQEKRIEWIDVYKGIVILMVVIGHSKIEMNWISRIIVACHMPAFFYLSGITLHEYDSMRNAIIVKAKSLLYPLLFGTIYYIAFWPNMTSVIIKEFLTLDGSGPLWFLYTLFFVDVFILFLIKIQKTEFIWLFFITAIICNYVFEDVINYKEYIYIPVRIFIASGFVYWGFITKNIKSNDCKFKYLAIPLYVFLTFLLKDNYIFDLHYGIVKPCITYFGLAFLGTISILLISKKIGKNRILEFYGKNSLPIMIIHYPLVYSKSVVNNLIEDSFICQTVTSIIVIIICTIMSLIINTYFPWIIKYPQKE